MTAVATRFGSSPTFGLAVVLWNRLQSVMNRPPWPAIRAAGGRLAADAEVLLAVGVEVATFCGRCDGRVTAGGRPKGADESTFFVRILLARLGTAIRWFLAHTILQYRWWHPDSDCSVTSILLTSAV